MASNVLKTRIQSKYDTLAAWNSSTFIPLSGEICVAIIPNSQSSPHDMDVGNPDSSGLSPYAIGIKVGDNIHRFSELPWIQAIAGDVYGWAKASTPPSASNISVTYNNNNNSDVQTAISGIESSLGNIVANGVDPATLGSALAQLQEQLSGIESDVFTSNPLSEPEDPNEEPAPTYPTKIIRSIVQNGLTITATGSAIEVADLPDIPLSKISDLAFPSGQIYNQTSNPIATKGYVDNLTTELSNKITGAMHFKGEVQTLPDATDSGTFSTYISGDVILVGTKEYVYNKGINENTSEWILLGDEGSYAVKGSITKADLTQALQTEIEGKLDSATAASTYVAQNGTDRLMTAAEGTKLAAIAEGAQVNVIENVKVNGTALTITNKAVDVDIPIMSIKSNETSGVVTKTPDANRAITFDPIAFDGEVKHLKQTDTTYLVLDCGNATDKLYS